MKLRTLLIMLMLFPLCCLSAEEKNITKNFKIAPNQRVFINGVSGLQVKFTSWEKNEGDIKINVKALSSDSKFAAEYVQNFDVTYKTDGNDIIIDFLETAKQGSWSPLDIFKGDFKYSFSKEITGEIHLPVTVLIVGDFKYSDISFAGFTETLSIKGKGNHISVKNCKKVNEINNEYGDVAVSSSAGKLNADLKMSPIVMDDFSGQAKIKNVGAFVTVNGFTGNLNLELYNTKCSIENVNGDVVAYSELGDLSFKKIEKVLEVYDKSGYVAVYDVNGFKLDGTKTTCNGEKISGKAKDKVFITTRNSSYRISNSSGSYFIDDEYSKSTFVSVQGTIYYSSSNSSFSGSDIKGDWKSNAEYCEISLNGISASKIEAEGRGKLFKSVVLNNPKKIEIKNQDADVSLTLSKDIKTSLFLSAFHGNLSSDFTIHKYEEGAASKSAERINGGGAVVSVETKNGSIFIKKQ